MFLIERRRVDRKLAVAKRLEWGCDGGGCALPGGTGAEPQVHRGCASERKHTTNNHHNPNGERSPAVATAAAAGSITTSDAHTARWRQCRNARRSDQVCEHRGSSQRRKVWIPREQVGAAARYLLQHRARVAPTPVPCKLRRQRSRATCSNPDVGNERHFTVDVAKGLGGMQFTCRRVQRSVVDAPPASRPAPVPACPRMSTNALPPSRAPLPSPGS